MITAEDFRKKVQLFVVDEEKRDWRWLWLRKRARGRLVFAGYMRHISQEIAMNEPYRLAVDFVNSLEALRHHSVVDNSNDSLFVPWNPYAALEEWWEGVRP